MNGYKQMLRDKMPKMLDLALRWCKAKNRWIDYVYDNTIRKTAPEKRSNTVKIILGLKQQYKRQEIYDHIRYTELKPVTKEQVNNIPKSMLFMNFKDSIDWSKLSVEDPNMYQYWFDVANWVNWFSEMHISIEDTYNHCRSWNMSKEEINAILMSKYKISDKLADYLIKSFK